MIRQKHLTPHDTQFMAEITARVSDDLQSIAPLGVDMWSKSEMTEDIFRKIQLILSSDHKFFKLTKFCAEKARSLLLAENHNGLNHTINFSPDRRLRLAILLSRLQAILFDEYDRHLTIAECNEMAKPLTHPTVRRQLERMSDNGAIHFVSAISSDRRESVKRVVPTPFCMSVGIVKVISQEILLYALLQDDRLAGALTETRYLNDWGMGQTTLAWVKKRYNEFYPVEHVRLVEETIELRR